MNSRVGEKYMTNEGYEVEITEYISAKDVEVTFENGYKVRRQFINILEGEVKNPYHKSVYGVGYFGIGSYKCNVNNITTKYYTCWRSMLGRCYDEKIQEKQPTYKGCTVDELWHNFQNFAQWFEQNYIEGWHLDKDILVKDNKLYSPETCCFVPRELNIQFTTHDKKRLVGVSKSNSYFRSIIRTGSVNTHIGTYKTEQEAIFAYSNVKNKYIRTLVEKYKNQLSEHAYTVLKERIDIEQKEFKKAMDEHEQSKF